MGPVPHILGVLMVATTVTCVIVHLVIPAIMFGWFGGVDCALAGTFVAWHQSATFRQYVRTHTSQA